MHNLLFPNVLFKKIAIIFVILYKYSSLMSCFLFFFEEISILFSLDMPMGRDDILREKC